MPVPASARRSRRAAAALLALAALGGCGGEPGGPTTAASGSSTATVTATAETAVVHFLDDSGRLVAERRPLDGPLGLRAALDALAEGPRAPGALPALPRGAVLRDARVADGTATADYSAAFERNYPPGGAAAELAVLAPIVYTATALPGVRRVRITVEGRVPELVGSQVDLSGPLSRADLPVTVVPAR